MSSLYKLSVQGIRLFDPERQETIQFGFPLTLICGQNGCGKTTIIECLKYATTGDLPPNSKGGAFINDPNIANRNVVLGQIKLAFKSINDKSMIVQRSMQLSKKRGRAGASTNTFKTLEGQLSVITKGVKTAISSKNADLDLLVPMYLGALPAILDYVIFCHQDDSLWPLSEASVLKKRFDDIFEASKFTKVLDNLKTIRKEMVTETKLLEQSVQHLKIDKARAQRISDQLKASEAKVENYTSEVAELTVQIEQREAEANRLFERNQHYQETFNEHERLKMHQKNLHKTKERLGTTMKFLDALDEALGSELANFTEVEKTKRSQLVQLEQELFDVDDEIQGCAEVIEQCTRTEGQLSGRREQYTKAKASLEQIEQSIDLDGEGPFIKRLQSHLSVEKQKAQDYDLRQQQALREATDKIRETRDSMLLEEQSKRYCEEDISNTHVKIKDLRSRLTQAHYDESNLELEKAQLETLERRYAQKTENNPAKELDKAISENKARLVSLEHELEEVTKAITACSRLADIYARVSLQKESLSIKLDTLDKMTRANNDRYKQLVGVDLSMETGESLLLEARSKVVAEVEAAQVLLNEKASRLNSIETMIASYESQLASTTDKIHHHKSKILSVLDEDEIPVYEKVVEELEENHNITLHNLNTFDVTKGFKVKAIELARAEKCCTLCKRPFESEQFLDNFVTLLEESVNSMSVTKLQESVDATKKELDDIRGIRSDVLEFQKLADVTKELAAKIASENEAKGQIESEHKEQARVVSTLTAKLEALDLLRSTMASLTRLSEEIRDVESHVRKAEDELADFGGSSASVGELQKEQLAKTQEIKVLRQRISEDVDLKYIQQKELTRLDIEIKDKSLAILSLEKSLAEVIGIKKAIAEHEASIESLGQRLERTGQTLRELKPRHEKLVAEERELRSGYEVRAAEMGASVTSLKQTLRTCEELRREVTEYESVTAKQIDTNQQKLTEARQKHKHLMERKAAITGQVKELLRELQDSVSVERNIRDNLEFRHVERELDVVHEKIQLLDISQAEAERDNYQAQSRELREVLLDLNSRHAGKVGEIKQIKDHIKQLNHDLGTEYKNVDSAYHHEWVKLQTNLLVSNDILTYSKALDGAIMKYHSAKMEDINRILRELWNQTYKGTDIDLVEIKSDVNVQAKGRSYNYRVVMYKNNVELDMRGRCSAGQKVLTSILIRLALAECFGSNCGMIALDEPTTNLDSENAESLASALNSIIEMRKNQKNFQLIVITHDEKFLSHINGDSFTDHFYRIQRDESQKSMIRSLPIRYIHTD